MVVKLSRPVAKLSLSPEGEARLRKRQMLRMLGRATHLKVTPEREERARKWLENPPPYPDAEAVETWAALDRDLERILGRALPKGYAPSHI